MNECRKIAADLSALIDGELSPARKAQIEAHVAGCADCRQRVAALRQLAAGVAAFPKLQPAPQFLADVRCKIGGAEERTSWVATLFRPFWLKVPIAALATIAILVGVLALLRPQRHAPPPAAAPGLMRADKSEEIQDEVAPSPVSQPASTAQPIAVPHEAELAWKGDPSSLGVTVPAATPAAALALPKDANGGAASLRARRELAYADKQQEELKPAPVALDRAKGAGETVVVADGRTPSEVRQRAEELARSLGGQWLEARLSNSFLVAVPSMNVESFRSLLTRRADTAVVAGQVAAAAPAGAGQLAPVRKQAAERLRTSAAEPTTVLEIVVQPAP